ncbi:serine hydrolase domain-containing protein [Phenylobacterium sp.]|uniref:serine hydrolase domain-containing protein n=1 Tax=Phenylobacterium sp. TaxID=1871053 RepID=UPI002DE5F238|nr:serine hydrolase domain-containing protein [Phenylobacterium sp.]
MSRTLSRRRLLEALAATPFAAAGFPALAQLPMATPRSLGFSPAGLKAMDDQFHALVDQQKLAGVVTLVARHGKVAHLDAYGKLNAAEPAPVKPDSIFRIASMTKPTIGTAMMMLWEEGRWKFDDPVSKHIPEFAGLKVRDASGSLVDQTSPMLMKQLVSHSAGFDRSAGYAGAKLQESDLQGMIDKLAKLPLAFQPGTDWRYGPSVDIQGYVVQKLSGQRLDHFMQSRLFGPLGMADTGFYVDPSKVARCAAIHVYKDGKVVPQSATNNVRTSPPQFLSGSGGLVSTAPDYFRFTQMILNGGQAGGRRYLKADTVRLMHTNLLNPGVNVTLYSPDTRGLGFGVDFAIVMDQAANHTSQAQDSFYWGGAFGTWFWIDPDHDMIVIGMVQNLNGSTPGQGTPPNREISAKAVAAALTDPKG